MNSPRLLVGLVCGAACLALFSGCESEQAACEREKRMSMRFDEMQMDLDSKLVGVNSGFVGVSNELASLRSNPPVVVQQVPTPMPTMIPAMAPVVVQPPAPAPMPMPTPISTSTTSSYDTITISDGYPNKREQLESLARSSRETIVYAPPPAPSKATASSSAGKGNIRVPIPARTIQTALKEAGFYRGAIDGKVGKGTIAAITAFQKSQGLKADGIVGKVTWQHLQAFVPAGMSTTRLK